MRQTLFSTYHPAINLLYFLAVIVFTFMSMQPMCVTLSFVAASVYCVFLKGWRKYMKTARFLLLLVPVVVLANMFFSGLGQTVLFSIAGNAFTLEAGVYGFTSGLMLASVLVWFMCYEEVMTTDRFLFLFAKLLPALSLVISMIFKLLPDLVTRGRMITNVQTALLGGVSCSASERRHQGIRMASVLMSVSMEGSIETSDSMRARGYGAADRTSYATYGWKVHDTLALVVLLVLIAVCAVLVYVATAQFTFYPALSVLNVLWWGYVPYLLLLFFPLLLELGRPA